MEKISGANRFAIPWAAATLHASSGVGARARASRGACMRRALLPVRRCSFSQAVQHPCRRGQRELKQLFRSNEEGSIEGGAFDGYLLLHKDIASRHSTAHR